MFDWLKDVSKQYPLLSLALGSVIVISIGMWQVYLLHRHNKDREQAAEKHQAEIDRLNKMIESIERKHKAEIRRNNASHKQTIDV